MEAFRQRPVGCHEHGGNVDETHPSRNRAESVTHQEPRPYCAGMRGLAIPPTDPHHLRSNHGATRNRHVVTEIHVVDALRREHKAPGKQVRSPPEQIEAWHKVARESEVG